ncbi:hypothetical protein SAMN05216227_101284 [Pseudorhodobacter antarcticus]|uniref:Uncharacterized protein n=1 Tax=Pseudorhodobacter antarcticus TaxID=1077947 RepID=A0A1H8G0K0_9RHOB|nr:hypothetical protein [Pseudorhodobacter antarcticus]SEN37621.1 hypothetical protein SAMN05216227_101284 [Pseudorhodobacter antarcticus]
MATEALKQAYAKRAEKIYRKAAKLTGLEQAEYVTAQLAKITDINMRTGVDMLVWVEFREGRPKVSLLASVLSAEGILAGTFVVSFLLCRFTLHFQWVLSIAVAFVLMILLRWVFRMFDRAFMFRRLFITTITVGLLLVGPAQFAFHFETEMGTLSWGGSPSLSLTLMWVIAACITAYFAHHESKST